MFNFNLENHSLLYPHMQSYIREREIRELDCRGDKIMLRNLERYSVEIGYDKDYITKEHYLSWIESIGGSESRMYFHKKHFRQFSKYLNDIGCTSYIAASPKHHKSFTPYIYSTDEINRIFVIADNWRDRYLMPDTISLVMPALLRLLYSTGMRIGEAVKIVNADVDFNMHTILLQKTKNRRQRLCAMNPSMEKVLNKYVQYRNKLSIPEVGSPGAPFFCNRRGQEVNPLTVRARFIYLLRAANIGVKEDGHYPRIHDLRHTAAIMAMKKLMATGKDIYCCLPQIAAYMGHTNPKASEYYLRLTPSSFTELLEKNSLNSIQMSEIINRCLSNKNDVENERI